MTAVVNSKRYPREWGEVQGLEGLRAVDPVVSIQRRPCCSLELPSTWSGAVAPVSWAALSLAPGVGNLRAKEIRKAHQRGLYFLGHKLVARGLELAVSNLIFI